MIETWKNVPGYYGRYQVSDMGRIRSFVNSSSRKVDDWHFIKSRISNCGDEIVTLSLMGKTKIYSIHRLVLLSFRGYSNLTCNHKNGIKTDNRLSNLEYISCSENNKHAYRIGLKSARGSKNGRSKLNETIASEIKKIHRENYITKQRCRELGRIYNVSPQAIYDIKTGRRWGHVK